MNGVYHLPARDELGFCNILMSALGGDGANMGAKLLFKIGAMKFNLDGGYDARYGSEKKGTATDVSVRFCEPGTNTRQSGPTNRPHYLVVFHDSLIEPLELYAGLQKDATCIVNTTQTPAVIRDKMHLASGRIVCVDATKIAHDCGSRLNMPLMALLCHEMQFPDDEVKQVITSQWPRAAKANMEAFGRAVVESQSLAVAADGKFAPVGPKTTRGPIGWRNMLNGGAIDALCYTTAGRDNRLAGQGRVPTFNPDACTHCGLCLTVCSDPGGLLWREGRMAGIDDRFCKGCMRCVEMCPENKRGHALSFAELESNS